MNKLRLLYIIVFCTVAFIACKKKEDKKEEPVVNNPTTTKTAKELLTDTSWKIVSITSTVAGDVWNNTAFVKPCNQDNTYCFNTNDTLTSYDTPSKCSPSDPDSTSGPYLLFSNNKKIYLNLKVGSVNIKDTTDVAQLDATTLILNVNYSGFPGVITFKH